MAFLHFSKMIFYLVFLLSTYESMLIGIESINSDKYLVILDNGIFLYNHDFTIKKTIWNKEFNRIKNIDIKKHIYNDNTYIFCIINNNLYFYDDNKNNIKNFDSLVNDNMINYFNIIPYNTKDNKLNCIKILCDYSYYYDYYLSFDYYNIDFHNNNNINRRNRLSNVKEVNEYLYHKRSICQSLISYNIIECLFYDNKYYLNLKYDIKKDAIKSSFEWWYFPDFNFIEFTSSKSEKNNYLICPLFLEINDEYNFTQCKLCDNDRDFSRSLFIENSYEEDCSHIKAFYFEETKKFGVICQKYNEFILLIIDSNIKEVINRKIIYIDCKDNQFNGEFSIIYNNSINDYNLISDYNFTDYPSCSFEQKEYDDFTKNKTNSDIESGQKEIFDDNNHFKTNHILSDEAFSELELFNTDTNSLKSNINKSKDYNKIHSTEFLTEEKESDMDDINNMSDDLRNTEYSSNAHIVTTKLIDTTQLINNASYINYQSKEIINSDIIYNYTDYITTKLVEKTDIVIHEGEIIIERTTINQTKEEFLNDIDTAIQNIEIGKNYEIKGNDFTITIKPTNTPPLPNTTHVEFDECEQILRATYNISNTSIITFLQMEMDNDNNDALYKQIQYSTYDDQLKRLDLTVCKDVETKIHYMIKNDANLDLSKVSDYKKMGVDILNINDDFFTNLCYAFSSSDNDMILEDRIKYIFQNYSLCEEGCSYNNLDIITRSIACDCKIQGNISTITNPLVFDTGKETSFFDSNIGVSQCYNLVFSLNNKSKNIGFIVFCLLMLIYIIAILVQIKKGIKRVSDFLYKEMIKYGYIEQGHPNFFENNKIENNKIELSSIMGVKKFNEKIGEEQIDKGKKKFKKTGKKKFKKKKKGMPIKISQQMTLVEDNTKIKKNNYNNETNPNKIFTKKTKRIIEDDDYNNFGIIKINLDLDKKSYMPKDSNQSLLNYTFDEAVRYDRRNIIRVFYIYLLSKQIIFRTFLQKSPLEIFPIRLTLFIFMLSCDLALNALFYFNDNISKKYHYASNIFLFAFSNNITIILYSTLVSYFILTLLSKLSNSSSAIRNIFQKEEEKIKKTKKYTTKEQTKKNIFYEVENVLKKFKIKIFILLLTETIFILFFWYFVTAFCHVYSSTQTSWLLDTFLAILSRFVLEIIFGFLFAKLYRISVASNCETLYKILICIYDFS